MKAPLFVIMALLSISMWVASSAHAASEGAGTKATADEAGLHRSNGERLLREAEQAADTTSALRVLAQAREELNAAITAEPINWAAHYLLACAVYGIAARTSGTEVGDTAVEGVRHARIAQELYGGDKYSGNIALILGKLLMAKAYDSRYSFAEAKALYLDAADSLNMATQLLPEDSVALTALADALSHLSVLESGKERVLLSLEMGQAFTSATLASPRKAYVYVDWGTALSRIAREESGERADSFYADADERFEAAAAMDPRNIRMLVNWGSSLLEHGRITTGSTARKYLEKGIDKSRTALAIDPGLTIAKLNLAIGQFRLARLAPDPARTTEIATAERMLLEIADSLDTSTYISLARVYALRGNKAECRRWLVKAAAVGDVNAKTDFATAPEWVSVSAEPWFRKMVEEASKQEDR